MLGNHSPCLGRQLKWDKKRAARTVRQVLLTAIWLGMTGDEMEPGPRAHPAPRWKVRQCFPGFIGADWGCWGLLRAEAEPQAVARLRGRILQTSGDSTEGKQSGEGLGVPCDSSVNVL